MPDIREITEFLEKTAPAELAESYDNVGLLIGNGGEDIPCVLLTLDTELAVAEEARELGAPLIISHHPLIFDPVKKITTETETGRTIISLIKNDIQLFAMHTNFDSAEGGLCDYLTEKIFGAGSYPAMDGGGASGTGRIATLAEPITLSALCERIKSALGLSSLRCVGDGEGLIKKAAVVGGGGGSMTREAHHSGADVYISGDFKYQHGRDAAGMNMALIEITHYDAEIIFTEYVKRLLHGRFGDSLKIFTSRKNKNVWRTV